MAGGTTRFGFETGAGGGEPGEARAATTLYGRDLHLDRSALAGLAVPPPSEGHPDPPERAAQTPAHTGKSGFPSLAKIFGRWNTGGDLVEHAASDSLVIPKDRSLRRMALIALAGAASLFAVALLLRLGNHPEPPRARPAPVVAPAPARPVAAPRPPVVAPAPPAAEAPPPVIQPAPRAPRVEPARPAARRAAAVRRRPAPAPDPDSLLPLNF